MKIFFTIIFILLTVCAFVLYGNFQGREDQEKEMQLKADFIALSTALKLYRLDNESIPTVEQGLKSLIVKPVKEPIPLNYKQGGYMSRDFKDPYGNLYIYRVENNVMILQSFGKNGRNDWCVKDDRCFEI